MGVCGSMKKSKSNPQLKQTLTFQSQTQSNTTSSILATKSSKEKRSSSLTPQMKRELNLSAKNSTAPRQVLTARQASFKETAKKVSLFQKSKFCPSSSEELKLRVQTKSFIDESNDVPTQKYRIISKIGEGSFGSVFYAKNLISKAEVAIKRIVKSQDNKVDDLSISNEIEILKRLDHPNIIKVFEVYNTQGTYSIITEYCAKGELFKCFQRKFCENQLAVLLYQILSGLSYLHSNGVIHRDLKLENILISNIELDEETKEEHFIVKLIDFGCAKFIDGSHRERSLVGTYFYMAPEVIKKKYSYKCDIWSVGVILYSLVTGEFPFDGEDNEDIVEAIKKGKYNVSHKALCDSSGELRDLLSKLLEVKEEKRLSAQEALNHPWFIKGKLFLINLPFDTEKKLMDNLIHFILKSKFQQIVLAYLCYNLPQTAETKSVTKLFYKLNTSNTGSITKSELFDGLIAFIGEEEAKEIIEELFMSLDGDNNGFIEYEELLRACISKNTILNDDELIQYAFKFFDKDNTDMITLEELKGMFREKCSTSKYLDDICRQIIDNNDSNCNGGINISNFKKMISNSFSEADGISPPPNQ